MKPRLLLTIVAAAAASTSAGALVLHALGLLPMYFFITVVAAPSLVLLLVLGIVAHRIHEQVFLHRLLSGVWIGLAATLAYDGIRLLLRAAGIFNFDVFFSHRIYGFMISGFPTDSGTALAVGWAYHFWNGITLAVMYTVVAGPMRWIYGLIWALLLEIAWLTALPSALNFTLSGQVIAVSLIGHSVYGIVLGVLSQRCIKE
jgi:uncharacterized protein DUF6789